MNSQEFNAAFRQLLPEVTRFLARRVAPSSVEDLASELFALAWSKRTEIPVGLEFPWLIKSARYLIANHNRKEQGRSRILATFTEPIAAPSAESVAIADLALATAWSELPARDKEVLSLWAIEGLEPAEIAIAISATENAVNTRLSRAKKKLLANFENN